MHFVYSLGTAYTGGVVGDLGGAFAVQGKPTVVVRAQVHDIVYDHSVDECSPSQITWHVHQHCLRVAAKSFDAMCSKTKDLDM